MTAPDPDVFGPGGGATSPWTTVTRMSGLDRVPVAGLLRVSQFELQDVRGSLIRQVGNCMARKPATWDIVAWYIDVESGRMELDERGGGDLHTRVQLPVERAGGIADLLAEAKRRDCKFAAVIVESSERVARVTYFGTKIEHELGKRDIEIFATDEGIDIGGKKATKVLMRRMKQALGEFHAINVMEQAWEGTRIHTREGYNIGHPPYGYIAVKEPHPAPAKRSRGLTRSKLAVDPARGPVITQMFAWRVTEQLTCGEIAARLNRHPDLYPAPQPTRAGTGLGQWTGQAVRGMLANPKYTGHMVWNRSTTRTGMTVQRHRRLRANPVDQWIWSDTPLIDLDTYRTAQTIGRKTRGSRSGGDANTHPATLNTYLLRGLVKCGTCGRRLHGVRSGGHTYYKCMGPRDAAYQRTMPNHPATLLVREDALLPALADAITARVFHPDRRSYLAAQHDAQPAALAAEHAQAIDAASTELDKITGRQNALLAELEDLDPADPATKTWRDRIRARFTELDTERTKVAAHRAGLIATQPATVDHNPAILDAMPHLTGNLATAPVHILRELLEALHVSVRLDNPRQAHLTITLTHDTPGTVAAIGTPDDGGDPATLHTFLGATAKRPTRHPPKKWTSNNRPRVARLTS